MRVGVIGLGLLGKALSARLLRSGHEILGYDISETARAQARELGVAVLADAKQVAAQSRILFLSLMTSGQRRALLWGDQQMSAALSPGTVILDTTTARPEDIVEDSRRLESQEIRLIDVCISGSSEVVSRGDAVALIGDAEEGAEYAKLIKTFSKALYFLGEPGQGNRMKLIVNVVFGLNRLVIAEALGLAAKSGFDLNTTLEILKAGGTYSTVMDTKGPKMAAAAYSPPEARLAQHAKDVGLILDYANTLGARMPVSEVHAALLKELLERGCGDYDNAAVFEAYR
jgi:3-hydroxyisobutyrate dehydrogenase-like beta-hydroxyacid dehydrogenase